MIPDNCLAIVDHSNVKVSDARSTRAVFKNPDRSPFHLVKYDGCVVRNVLACDWIVIRPGIGVIVVELKGCDVAHAAEQILATLAFVDQAGIEPRRRAAVVVCTRFPRFDTKVQRLAQQISRKFHAPLHVRTHGRDLVFEDLLSFG